MTPTTQTLPPDINRLAAALSVMIATAKQQDRNSDKPVNSKDNGND